MTDHHAIADTWARGPAAARCDIYRAAAERRNRRLALERAAAQRHVSVRLYPVNYVDLTPEEIEAASERVIASAAALVVTVVFLTALVRMAA